MDYGPNCPKEKPRLWERGLRLQTVTMDDFRHGERKKHIQCYTSGDRPKFHCVCPNSVELKLGTWNFSR